jgi:GT2 family glycosyltransferase
LVDTFPPASIIVVGFNSATWLPGCLNSLGEQDYPGRFEIIFVDNSSTDESVTLVRDGFPSVRIVESGGNLGYAGGNNAGAWHATGDILAFVNPDTIAQPDWLAELVRPLLEDQTIGATTSKIVLMDQPEIINTCGNAISLSGITTCHRAGEPAASVDADEEVPAVSGAACAISSHLFRRLGGFDERFWMYLEDTDLSWRARLAGYRCTLAARSVVAHNYSFTLAPAKTGVIERNRYLMLAKNLSLRSLAALAPMLLLGELLTWGWAAWHGPRHVAAKFRAGRWVLGNRREIRTAHNLAQAMRVVPDGSILPAFRLTPPVAEVSRNIAARYTSAVLSPALIAIAALSLVCINRLEGDWGPERHMGPSDLPQPTGSGT